jgi:hypothetical protein
VRAARGVDGGARGVDGGARRRRRRRPKRQFAGLANVMSGFDSLLDMLDDSDSEDGG